MAIVLRLRHFIDAHKAVTVFLVLGLIALFDRWESHTAWVYLGLHGGYGVLWLLKSSIFPDKSWEEPTSLSYGLVVWFSLALYWVAPLIITYYNVVAPAWLLGLAVFVFAHGVFFHFAADMQKHVQLQLRPGKLISDLLFARVRNMNYFGELLIYLSFAMLPMHWAPFLVLGLYVFFVWSPNMTKKEKSLSRYPEYAAYSRRSTLLIPGLY
jgi:steroid 5-alpha reductase family enzyme